MYLTTHQLAALLEMSPPGSGVFFTSDTEGAPAEDAAATPCEIKITHWVGGDARTAGEHPPRGLELGEVREVDLTVEPTGRVREPETA